MANKRIDEATGVETVGHEWDGIEELDNPMPRWWLWSFYASIVFAIAYCIAYPAWPLVQKGTEGVLGWTSRGALAGEIDAEQARRAPILAALAETPLERLPDNPELMRAAIDGGRAAFKVNCVQCHGAGAAGLERQIGALADGMGQHDRQTRRGQGDQGVNGQSQGLQRHGGPMQEGRGAA